MNHRSKFGFAALTAALVLGLQIAAPANAQEHEHFGRPAARADGHGQVLDNRYNHGHYYPAIGASVRVLPEGYRPYYLGGRPYYFVSGVWYAPGGPGFLVVRAPIGLVISVLPPYYSTVWIGGIPYYYDSGAERLCGRGAARECGSAIRATGKCPRGSDHVSQEWSDG
jgi:hypothetical protein